MKTLLSVWMALAALLIGCTYRAAPIPAAESPRAVPPEARESKSATAPASWDRVSPPGSGLSFEVPKGWSNPGSGSFLAPDGQGAIVVIWDDRANAALLPNHATILEQFPMDLGWAHGTSYTMVITESAARGGTLIAAERHVVVSIGARTYDFYASARNLDELNQLAPILQRALASVQLR